MRILGSPTKIYMKIPCLPPNQHWIPGFANKIQLPIWDRPYKNENLRSTSVQSIFKFSLVVTCGWRPSIFYGHKRGSSMLILKVRPAYMNICITSKILTFARYFLLNWTFNCKPFHFSFGLCTSYIFLLEFIYSYLFYDIIMISWFDHNEPQIALGLAEPKLALTSLMALSFLSCTAHLSDPFSYCVEFKWSVLWWETFTGCVYVSHLLLIHSFLFSSTYQTLCNACGLRVRKEGWSPCPFGFPDRVREIVPEPRTSEQAWDD